MKRIGVVRSALRAYYCPRSGGVSRATEVVRDTCQAMRCAGVVCVPIGGPAGTACAEVPVAGGACDMGIGVIGIGAYSPIGDENGMGMDTGTGTGMTRQIGITSGTGTRSGNVAIGGIGAAWAIGGANCGVYCGAYCGANCGAYCWPTGGANGWFTGGANG
ncbi:MAG: hypothetical protein HY827_03145 [Actinobacteria bacterium]|nr:hypothetical protein [Actinomycetota bacterium]